MILELQRRGVQIFISTHDYMLASYFEVRKQQGDKIIFHSLSHNSQNLCLEYENAEKFAALKNNMIISAFNELLNDIYDMEV